MVSVLPISDTMGRALQTKTVKEHGKESSVQSKDALPSRGRALDGLAVLDQFASTIGRDVKFIKARHPAGEVFLR